MSLPDFLIIGAQRCGTTSLYEYIIKHSLVAPASSKEVHFFDYNFSKGTSWYMSHFKQKNDSNVITGEASPFYIFHPLAARRVSEIIPKIKLIVLLRNPVDRAYSHYQLQIRYGNEMLSFEEAINAENERLRGEREKILSDENYHSFNYQKFSYLARGIYVDNLKVWFSYFNDKQILILKSEDFFSNPSLILKNVFKFLELPDFNISEYVKYNEGQYNEMNPATRKFLIDYFKPHNERLYKFLDMDFNWNR